jgi:hypothetical protein
MTDHSTETGSSQRQRDTGHNPCVAGIFLGISFVTLQGHGSGDDGDVAVWKDHGHRLQVQLSAAAASVKLLHCPLDKRSGRYHHLIAGPYRRSDLRINVIAAMNDAALHGMCEHQRNTGAGGHGHNVLLRWR